jgi:hypothetical protein
MVAVGRRHCSGELICAVCTRAAYPKASSEPATDGPAARSGEVVYPNGRAPTRRNVVIATGTPAPGFSLKDQFGREISLDDFRDRRHVLLLSYPLDWTPT